jgi:wyosine [tRNA(Phe)-imidazoG37] synthetase (radical SAM superfamily)
MDVAITESGEPVLYAIAVSVSAAVTLTAPEYNVPVVSIGVLPSVVYRMEAPDVGELIVTEIVSPVV